MTTHNMTPKLTPAQYKALKAWPDDQCLGVLHQSGHWCWLGKDDRVMVCAVGTMMELNSLRLALINVKHHTATKVQPADDPRNENKLTFREVCIADALTGECEIKIKAERKAVIGEIRDAMGRMRTYFEGDLISVDEIKLLLMRIEAAL